MADLNPLNAWRRLMARPNDDRTKTLVVAFLVSLVCAVLVSGATVALRPIQAANRAAEQQARMEALIVGIPGMAALMDQEGGALSTVVIDLARGAAAAGVSPETLAAALEQSDNWTPLERARDLAGIGSRPDFVQVFLLRNAAGDLSLALLPVSGAGYNGPINALVALRGDMNTIAGLAITGQSETPGLGARIEEAAWLDQFRGLPTSDATGTIRFAVARGQAGNEYEVDGITGATRTSNAVTQMMRFWLGPDGYGPLIAAVRHGEF